MKPALLAHGAAVWAVVRDRIASFVRAAAGHSLGEFTAYHAAGSFSLADAARVVRKRGELMLDTGKTRPGTMAAILGETSVPIEALCERATAEAGEVVTANYNSPGQVVVSGEVAGVERLMSLAQEFGAKRAIRLQVSGAFHSPLMRPASDGLRAAIQSTPLQSPHFPVFANVTAEAVTEPARAGELLVQQLTAPVRWTQVMAALDAAHPEAVFVEMGPGSVLAGLARKIVPGREVLSCGTATEVDALLQRLEAA